MASAINSLLGSAQAAGGTSAAAPTPAPTEQMFLQLLVAQIKNQDPLNPTDGSQFVAQLAQFSELENVVAIRGDIEKGQAAAAAAANGTGAPAPAPPASDTTPAANSNTQN